MKTGSLLDRRCERTGLAVAVFSGVDAARRVGGTAFHESSIVKQRVVTGAVRWQTQNTRSRGP